MAVMMFVCLCDDVCVALCRSLCRVVMMFVTFSDAVCVAL